MSNSNFCLEQRLRQQSQRQKILLFALISSALVHGVLAAIQLKPYPPSEVSTQEEIPIEVVIIEEPEPEPKPESEPEPIKTEVIPATIEPEPQPVPQINTPTPQVEPKIEPEVTPIKPEPQTVLTSPSPSESVVEQTNTPSAVTENSTNQEPLQTTSLAPQTAETPPPQPRKQSISCLSECNPEYPFALDGAEGSASVQLVIGPNGQVISVTLIRGHQNNEINRQALLAARKMQFTPTGNTVEVQVTLNFTVAGSQFDRVAKQRQQQQEQQHQAQQQLEQQQQEREEELPEQPLIPRDAPLLPDIQERLDNN